MQEWGMYGAISKIYVLYLRNHIQICIKQKMGPWRVDQMKDWTWRKRERNETATVKSQILSNFHVSSSQQQQQAIVCSMLLHSTNHQIRLQLLGSLSLCWFSSEEESGEEAEEDAHGSSLPGEVVPYRIHQDEWKSRHTVCYRLDYDHHTTAFRSW